jgi:hypothetical protein
MAAARVTSGGGVASGAGFAARAGSARVTAAVEVLVPEADGRNAAARRQGDRGSQDEEVSHDSLLQYRFIPATNHPDHENRPARAVRGKSQRATRIPAFARHAMSVVGGAATT